MFFNLLLLLFCFVSHCGTTTTHVTGEKGENVILPCDFEAREISDIVLSRLLKDILVCENEECESENGRAFKEGSCDVIIKDLIFSDAGKYFLRLYYKNDQRELEQQIRKYHLHIHDGISVKKGEELKMDVLLINADKVQHQSRRSTGWKEVWSRRDGVRSDRLTVSDETLTVYAFTVTDTGTYRVLDYEGEILITVTASTHPDREPLSWTEKLNEYFVVSMVIVYLVIMAIQIVMRIAGYW
ncbi:uncharacterized protein LOC127501204 [Ctenopharyngodon idella]|uniref:uncharacterized protein LOC127501204 n=1 Tax=Ctenopharyngodon idella TaxID=7959 RepID=UPI00223060E4|nr:uncharacterized protein LOC127501204 [Ctenopharyngodon idella]